MTLLGEEVEAASFSHGKKSGLDNVWMWCDKPGLELNEDEGLKWFRFLVFFVRGTQTRSQAQKIVE